MLLFLSVTGIVLSIILLYFNYKKIDSSIYLGSFFFLVSIYGLIQYVLFYSESLFLISLFYINFTFLTYFIGPVFYWYVRSVLEDDARLKKKDLWHFLPALIYLIAAIPHIFSPWPDKLKEASEIVNSISFLAKNEPTVLHHFLPTLVIHISRPLLVLGYTIWSFILFIRYLTNNRESGVFPNQRYMIKWISMLLGLLFILVISQMIILGEAYASRDSKLFFTFNLLQIISAGGLTGLLITPFFFPGILYGLPRLPELIIQDNKTTPEGHQSSESEKKKMPVLESDYIDLIRNKVEYCMTDQKLYLHVDCNLVNTSKCLNLPVHHIAYFFREVKRQSFNDYRNELRVNHAKQLIREGKAKELTLEGIALQSGFSTRNTFFTAFKKSEGISPGTYSAKFFN